MREVTGRFLMRPLAPAEVLRDRCHQLVHEAIEGLERVFQRIDGDPKPRLGPSGVSADATQRPRSCVSRTSAQKPEQARRIVRTIMGAPA